MTSASKFHIEPNCGIFDVSTKIDGVSDDVKTPYLYTEKPCVEAYTQQSYNGPVGRPRKHVQQRENDTNQIDKEKKSVYDQSDQFPLSDDGSGLGRLSVLALR